MTKVHNPGFFTDEELAEIREEAKELPDYFRPGRLASGVSWWCEPCSVEVYDRRCPHCGKLKGDPK
jgi:rubrerythrin